MSQVLWDREKLVGNNVAWMVGPGLFRMGNGHKIVWCCTSCHGSTESSKMGLLAVLPGTVVCAPLWGWLVRNQEGLVEIYQVFRWDATFQTKKPSCLILKFAYEVVYKAVNLCSQGRLRLPFNRLMSKSSYVRDTHFIVSETQCILCSPLDSIFYLSIASKILIIAPRWRKAIWCFADGH